MKKVVFLVVLVVWSGVCDLFGQQFLPSGVRVVATNSVNSIPMGLSILGQVVITGSSTNPVSDLVCELDLSQGTLPDINGILVLDGNFTMGCAELFYWPRMFNNNLQIGSVGLDVYNLQRFMNSDPATVLADSGPGSVDQENIIFDQKLKNSVILYQLVNGIPSTGFVGPITRANINGRLNEAFGNVMNHFNASNRVAMLFTNLNVVAPKTLTVMIDSPSAVSNLNFRVVDTSCKVACPQIHALSFGQEKMLGSFVTIYGSVWIGRNCYVETSNNLRDWSPVGSVMPTTTNLQYTLSTGSGQQFYRLKQ